MRLIGKKTAPFAPNVHLHLALETEEYAFVYGLLALKFVLVYRQI